MSYFKTTVFMAGSGTVDDPFREIVLHWEWEGDTLVAVMESEKLRRKRPVACFNVAWTSPPRSAKVIASLSSLDATEAGMATSL